LPLLLGPAGIGASPIVRVVPLASVDDDGGLNDLKTRNYVDSFSREELRSHVVHGRSEDALYGNAQTQGQQLNEQMHEDQEDQNQQDQEDEQKT
jgi:ABC-type iron transport system FetAB ATPase subunit